MKKPQNSINRHLWCAFRCHFLFVFIFICVNVNAKFNIYCYVGNNKCKALTTPLIVVTCAYQRRIRHANIYNIHNIIIYNLIHTCIPALKSIQHVFKYSFVLPSAFCLFDNFPEKNLSLLMCFLMLKRLIYTFCNFKFIHYIYMCVKVKNSKRRRKVTFFAKLNVPIHYSSTPMIMI